MIRNKSLYKINIFLLCLFGANISFAELKVIADLGGESAVRFYEPIQPIHSENAPRHPNAIPPFVPEEKMLPVISHKWTLGKVSPKSVNLPGATPLFLIGADDTSINWLQAKKQYLISINATGLVINVKNMEQLRQLRQVEPSLKLIPAPADSLGDRLNIYHYPLLITSKGISQ
ncbi:integrating conjugative element protein [Pasteurella skyensis]|uniref:integrating conjugative element protein n=1 Tax=Phocoenobacter skyensis TaxID=97481 RepID=UPI002760677C|nr:integrating conjugative element protein [Pasteurella skyensis]MDP8189078.1 integrating conjugative element protein [Pasteurella skyensis]